MAGRTEARIAALLSLLAATLIAHTLLLHPPRAVAFTDRLLSALGRFDGRQLIELINRRNMILLCNAILLVILKDAGLLAAPAGRRATTAAGGEDACCEAQPKPKSVVDASPSTAVAAAGASDANSATVADAARVQQRERRRRDPGHEPDKTTARLRRVKPSPTGAAHKKEHTVARETDDPAEKQSSERCSFNGFHHGVGSEIAALDGKMACLRSEQVARDERSRVEKEMARQESEAECVDDVDEMNRRFEEFIASMRRNMQLESRQLVKV